MARQRPNKTYELFVCACSVGLNHGVDNLIFITLFIVASGLTLFLRVTRVCICLHNGFIKNIEIIIWLLNVRCVVETI